MSVSLQQGSLNRSQQEELAKEYAGLVKHIAKRMALSLPQHVDTEDLINEGIIGFMEALKRFDASKGAQFKTFASNRIRGAILDFLRKRDFASRGARRRLRELNHAEESLTHELGRYPTPVELAYKMGVNTEEVARRKREGHLGYVSSLNETAMRTESTETHMDNLQSSEPDVSDIAAKNERVESLRANLELLPEREQLLLNLYYFEGLNISEIAQVLSVSEARVSQLHRRALGKLKDAIEPTKKAGSR
ncbi:MAG TPA: FliA/WhiG family RNA polymerase sigma factor [Phycisphaerales bacterium]|nr:FliA/WhiG family RNA polymerase sigma factor [Phycisphaerales bacterium]